MTISGLIEVRGVGILRLDALERARLALLVDLVEPSEIERLPESRAEEVLGLSVPLIALAPFEPSAAAKLRFALRALQRRAGALDTGSSNPMQRRGCPQVLTTVMTSGPNDAIRRRVGRTI